MKTLFKFVTNRKMLWKMVIFMKKGGAYLDSRTSENVNTTHLQGSITAVDSRGHKYQLVDDRSNTLRRYNAGFSFLLSRTVLRSDLIHVSNAIKETWTQTGWFITGIFNTLKLEILFLWCCQSIGCSNKFGNTCTFYINKAHFALEYIHIHILW